MKEYPRSRKTFLGLLFILLFIPVLQAQEMNIPYLKCEITLSKNKIVSGEPVSLCFTFTNISDGEVSVYLNDMYDVWDTNADTRLETEVLKISVQDSQGNQIPRRKLLCRPHSQMSVFSSRLNPGETVTGEYPLHLRVSTRLEPGHYRVIINSFVLSHGYMSREYIESVVSGVKRMQSRPERFSGPSLTLEVEPYNEAKLVTAYDALMEKARHALASPLGGWRGEDYTDIPMPIRTILWADGPTAVPYQIDVMYDSEKGFRYWPPALVNTWDNIVRYATTEQIKSVIEMARHTKCKKNTQRENYYSYYYQPGLAWAIHQWHTQGSETIRDLTKELAELLPEDEPCPPAMEFGQWPYGKP